jgi:hypothetical protein
LNYTVKFKETLDAFVQPPAAETASQSKVGLFKEPWFLSSLGVAVFLSTLLLAFHSFLPAHWSKYDFLFARNHKLAQGEAVRNTPNLLGLAFSLPTVLAMVLVAAVLVVSNKAVSTTYLLPLDEAHPASSDLFVTAFVPSSDPACNVSMPSFQPQSFVGFSPGFEHVDASWNFTHVKLASGNYSACSCTAKCTSCSVQLTSEVVLTVPSSRQLLLLRANSSESRVMWLARPSNATNVLAGDVVHTLSVMNSFRRDVQTNFSGSNLLLAYSGVPVHDSFHNCYRQLRVLFHLCGDHIFVAVRLTGARRYPASRPP